MRQSTHYAAFVSEYQVLVGGQLQRDVRLLVGQMVDVIAAGLFAPGSSGVHRQYRGDPPFYNAGDRGITTTPVIPRYLEGR